MAITIISTPTPTSSKPVFHWQPIKARGGEYGNVVLSLHHGGRLHAAAISVKHASIAQWRENTLMLTQLLLSFWLWL